MSRGPLVTLVLVVVAAAVLLMVNLTTGSPAPSGASAPAAPAATAPPASTAETAAAADTPTQFPARVKYVGEVETANGQVPISLTVQGDRAKIYVCDNEQIESWQQGSARDGQIEATGRGSDHLTARLDGDRLTGTVLVSGHPEWTFAATPTTDPRAGVYRASNDQRTAGWIVQEGSGRQVGLGRAPGGAVIPARPLAVDALPPDVQAVDGGTDVLAGW